MAKTVLIIDDSDSLRRVVNIALSGAGYNTLEACDGEDALRKLDGRKIHLMICDVNMPKMDGITFLKQVQQLAIYKFTPIIMLTTESSASMRGEGKAAGAKAWVVKPFRPDQMIEAAKKLILP